MSEAGAVVEVATDPATAFEVFTRDTGSWWLPDRSLWGDPGTVRFEPGVGGRLRLESGREAGRIEVWEPGPRLVFSYESTEVEVRFEAIPTGTRVVLRHSGWDQRPGPWATMLARFAERSIERALLTRLGAFLDAIGAGDLDFFQRYLTEDAYLVFPGANNTFTKQQCIDSMGSHPPYVKYEIERPRIVHLGESAVALTHHAVVRGEDSTAWNLVVSSVFTREDGEWKLALYQWTPAE